MSNRLTITMKKGKMLSLSNKTIPNIMDRMFLHISTENFPKAKSEMNAVKESIRELEKLIAEYEKAKKNLKY